MNLLRAAKALLQWVVLMLRRLGIRGNADLSEAKTLRVSVTEPGEHPVRFASVGGAAAAKAALLRLCAPLHIAAADARMDDPENKSSGSHKAPQGGMRAFLYGPPGCGKTLLAHALAGELNLPLLAMSAAEFRELYACSGDVLAGQLRELFNTAMRRAPCVVFIDDLETIARRRDSGEIAPSRNPSRPDQQDTGEQILQQLLHALDALPLQSPRVVVLGASSEHAQIDEALLRPGRLARQIPLVMPDERERAEIIALLARNHAELGELDALALAGRTAGYSGASLRELLAHAAFLVASRDGQDPPPTVEPADLARALAECPPA